MNFHNTLIVAVLGATVLLIAGQPAAADDQSRGDVKWQKIDTDGDGRVSRAEAEAAQRGRLVENFDKVDTNRDGYLTREEMQAVRAQHRQEAKGRMESKWREADMNGDGQISLDEAQAKMPRLAERFNSLDADKNGTLSREEIRAGHSRHRAN